MLIRYNMFVLLLFCTVFSLSSQETNLANSITENVVPDKVYFGGSLGLPNLLNLHCGYTVENLYVGLTMPLFAVLQYQSKPAGDMTQPTTGLGGFQLNLGPALVWDWGMVALSSVAAFGGSTDVEGKTSPFGYLGAALDLKLLIFWAEAGLAYGWFVDGQGVIPLVQLGIMF